MDTVSDSFALRFLIAVVLVGLALAGFFAAVAYIRRRNPGMAFLGQSAARHQRLSVVESIALDGRRRVVLVRRDDVEHLLLLGGTGDLVVEQGIAPPDAAEETARKDGPDFREDEVDAVDTADEPARAPTPASALSRPPQNTLPADGDLGLRYTRSWEDDEGPRADMPVMPVRNVEVPVEKEKVQRVPDQQPVAAIRPVTLSRSERPMPPAAAAAPPARPAAAQLSPEETALARELEAARRRGSAGTPPPALPAEASFTDFDRVLEREMEAQLEAARRDGRGRSAPPQQQGGVVPQGSREGGTPEQATFQSGLARLFGGSGKAEENGDR